MGQYHTIVNLDKEEMLDPHKFGAGLKLAEFAEVGTIMKALTVLLSESNGRGGGDIYQYVTKKEDATGLYPPELPEEIQVSRVDRDSELGTSHVPHVSGHWAGDRIMIVGDYTEREPPEHLIGETYTSIVRRDPEEFTESDRYVEHEELNDKQREAYQEDRGIRFKDDTPMFRVTYEVTHECSLWTVAHEFFTDISNEVIASIRQFTDPEWCSLHRIDLEETGWRRIDEEPTHRHTQLPDALSIGEEDEDVLGVSR